MTTDRGRDLGHPPLEFPFFGLAEWTGPRWVEFYEGPIGRPVTTLWLGHRVPHGRAHVSVGTNNQRFEGLGLGEDLAFGSMFTLSERMRPDSSSVQFPLGFNKVQVDCVQARSEEWRTWPQVSCSVDDDEMRLSYRSYAWGWAGFICDVGTAGIKLVGVEIEPEAVSLVTVLDPGGYGFDPTRPLFNSDLYDRPDQPDHARLPLPWAKTMHKDQRALIEQHGLG